MLQEAVEPSLRFWGMASQIPCSVSLIPELKRDRVCVQKKPLESSHCTQMGFTLVSGVVLPPPRGLVAAGAFLHLWCPACLSLLEASSEELSFSLARRAGAQSKLRCRRNLSLLSPGGHWTARKNKQGIMRHRGLKTAPSNPSDLSLPAQLGPPHLDSARAGAREPAGPQHPLSQYKAPQAAGTFCKPDFGQKHQI